MDKMIKVLSDSISERLQGDFISTRLLFYFPRMVNLVDIAHCSGIIVDTPPAFASPSISGAATDDKYARVRACVEAFRGKFGLTMLVGRSNNPQCLVNVILVVGHEKLNVEMQRLFSSNFNRHISVVKIPKSGGVSVAYPAPTRSCLNQSTFIGR